MKGRWKILAAMTMSLLMAFGLNSAVSAEEEYVVLEEADDSAFVDFDYEEDSYADFDQEEAFVEEYIPEGEYFEGETEFIEEYEDEAAAAIVGEDNETASGDTPADPTQPTQPEDPAEALTITFDANGGYFLNPDTLEKTTTYVITVVKGEKATTENKPVYDDMFFSGWFMDKECKEKIDVDVDENFVPEVTMTLYAGWHDKHDLQWVQVTPATCTEGSEMFHICSICGFMAGTKAVPALGHDPKVTKKAVAATCTKTGLTAEKTCSRCGEVIEKQKTVAKKKHHYVKKKKGYAATCTKDGLTPLFRCKYCNGIKEKQKVIPKLGHDFQTTKKAVAATCTKDGKTAEIKCTRCGKVKQKQTTIPKLGHNLKVTKKAVAATCTKAGKTAEKTCTRCKKVIEKQKTVKKLGHKKVTDPAVPATCKSEGKTKGVHCSRCKKVLTPQKVIPKTNDHKFGNWIITKQPTVNSEGTKTRTCSVCGKKETATVPKINASIRLSRSEVTLRIGVYQSEFVNISASGLASGDSVRSWSSSNTSVATVDGSGKITARGAGSATVTATTRLGASASVRVTVQRSTMQTTSLSAQVLDKRIPGRYGNRPAGSAVDGVVTMKAGTTAQITPYYTPGLTNESITYSIEGSSAYISVNNKGLITATNISSPLATGLVVVKSGQCSVRIRVTVIR